MIHFSKTDEKSSSSLSKGRTGDCCWETRSVIIATTGSRARVRERQKSQEPLSLCRDRTRQRRWLNTWHISAYTDGEDTTGRSNCNYTSSKDQMGLRTRSRVKVFFKFCRINVLTTWRIFDLPWQLHDLVSTVIRLGSRRIHLHTWARKKVKIKHQRTSTSLNNSASITKISARDLSALAPRQFF